MQNKRGIAQAFSETPHGLVLRQAEVFDVFDISRVLVRSITELCAEDHENDPQILADWTANKDPATIKNWIRSGAELWVAEDAKQIAAVGALRQFEITLLCIHPEHCGRGIGAALLHRLEQEILATGHKEGRLEATRTAFRFYERHGWQATGRRCDRNDLSCFAMHKLLHSLE